MANVERWASDRLGDLVTLVEAAMPNERLSPDELLAVLWDQPGLVAGTTDGDGAVAVTLVEEGDRRVGAVLLLAVHPGARRQGRGTALLTAAEAWTREAGGQAMAIGAPTGNESTAASGASLWPGVDVHRMPAMLCLVETAGYVATGARCNLSMPASFRAEPPVSISIRRVIAAADEQAVMALVAAEFPGWSGAVSRGIDRGSCLVAVADGEAGGADGADRSVVVGFAAHSVDRDGWLGPMGTAAAHRRRGIGAALVGAVARDLMIANHRDVEVVGADQVRLFVRSGGSVSRVFRTFRRPLG